MTSAFLFNAFDVAPDLKRPLFALGLSLVVASSFVAYRTLPASIVKAGPAQVLSLEHKSFARSGIAEKVHVRLRPSQGHSVNLVLDEHFTRAYSVEKTTPAAKTITSENGELVYTFDAPADDDLSLQLSLRPLSWGQQDVNLRAEVPGVIGAQSTLSQFVLP